MIPAFTDSGNLPPGLHVANWKEIVDRFGTNERRRKLLSGLHAAFLALQKAGCEKAYLDGSLVTIKEYPADFDGCWEIEGVSLELLDKVLQDFSNKQAAQKRKFGGELFPSLPSIGGEAAFLDLFQTDKLTGERKGIIEIDLRTLE